MGLIVSRLTGKVKRILDRSPGYCYVLKNLPQSPDYFHECRYPTLIHVILEFTLKFEGGTDDRTIGNAELLSNVFRAYSGVGKDHHVRYCVFHLT